MTHSLSRRQFLTTTAAAGGMLALGACTTTPIAQLGAKKTAGAKAKAAPKFLSLYGARPKEQFPLPALKPKQLAPKYRRQRVRYRTKERPGTVVVDTRRYYLYHVERGGKAMRYGVGLGRQGFEWSGRARIAWKQKWPKWTPPEEMIERQPKLKKWSAENGGMPPGLKNPLGARALYIFQDGKDTLYRLHGTGEIWSIGKAVSSGCVRLIHQDIIDLYSRVRSGSKIVVR